jgi:hypothetical protein
VRSWRSVCPERHTHRSGTMTATPEEPSAYTPTERNTTRQIIINFVNEECTFYRVHLTGFILIPLVASGIFYASNGEFYVEYLDALFLCYSSMTVTGLTTVNLSTLTPWQQVMLYFLMIIVSVFLSKQRGRGLICG